MILVRTFKKFTFGKKVSNFNSPILFLLKVLSLGEIVKLEKNHMTGEPPSVRDQDNTIQTFTADFILETYSTVLMRKNTLQCTSKSKEN